MDDSKPPSLPVTARQPTFDELLQEATREGDALIVEDEAVRRIECSKVLTTYYFTKPQHSAHPSAIKRQLQKREDGYHLHMQAYLYDENLRPALDRWVQFFQRQDEAAKGKLSPAQSRTTGAFGHTLH